MSQESSNPPSRNKIQLSQQQVLAGLAVILLTALPTTLNAIPDPFIRFLCIMLGFVVIFWVGLRLTLPQKK